MKNISGHRNKPEKIRRKRARLQGGAQRQPRGIWVKWRQYCSASDHRSLALRVDRISSAISVASLSLLPSSGPFCFTCTLASSHVSLSGSRDLKHPYLLSHLPRESRNAQESCCVFFPRAYDPPLHSTLFLFPWYFVKSREITLTVN